MAQLYLISHHSPSVQSVYQINHHSPSIYQISHHLLSVQSIHQISHHPPSVKSVYQLSHHPPSVQSVYQISDHPPSVHHSLSVFFILSNQSLFPISIFHHSFFLLLYFISHCFSSVRLITKLNYRLTFITILLKWRK